MIGWGDAALFSYHNYFSPAAVMVEHIIAWQRSQNAPKVIKRPNFAIMQMWMPLLILSSPALASIAECGTQQF